MVIKHVFTSQKADGSDTTLVRPSDWNADHVGEHVHDNKTLLDTYAQIETDLDDAVSKKHSNSLDHNNSLDHSHSNKTQLDLLTDGDHDVSPHAPSNAQKNSDITKAEIETKLIGEISSHSHAGGGQAFPIGSVFISVVSTNPNTLLGYGTWAAIAAGRVLIGLDSGDTDFDAVEEMGGAKTSTPNAHSGATVGDHTNVAVPATATTAVKIGTAGATGAAQTHTHTIASIVHTIGQAITHAAMSIVQPYFVVYIWKRTA